MNNFDEMMYELKEAEAARFSTAGESMNRLGMQLSSDKAIDGYLLVVRKKFLDDSTFYAISSKNVDEECSMSMLIKLILSMYRDKYHDDDAHIMSFISEIGDRAKKEWGKYK